MLLRCDMQSKTAIALLLSAGRVTYIDFYILQVKVPANNNLIMAIQVPSPDAVPRAFPALVLPSQA